jgi:hypothetical protein
VAASSARAAPSAASRAMAVRGRAFGYIMEW